MSFQRYFTIREGAPKLTKELGVKNVMAVPKIIKIAINVGAGKR